MHPSFATRVFNEKTVNYLELEFAAATRASGGVDGRVSN